MPRSRRKKRKGQSSRRREPKLEFSSFSLGDTDPDAFKKTLLEAARQSVEDFPKTLEKIKGLLRDRDPIGFLASVAMYSLQSFVDAHGNQSRPSIALEQHHVELLQAVLLTLPPSEWGVMPVTADLVEVLYP
jgi:hypothetical protein